MDSPTSVQIMDPYIRAEVKTTKISATTPAFRKLTHDINT
jgi:hypothetical protein